jgi:hypothetical protein
MHKKARTDMFLTAPFSLTSQQHGRYAEEDAIDACSEFGWAKNPAFEEFCLLDVQAIIMFCCREHPSTQLLDLLLALLYDDTTFYVPL